MNSITKMLKMLQKYYKQLQGEWYHTRERITMEVCGNRNDIDKVTIICFNQTKGLIKRFSNRKRRIFIMARRIKEPAIIHRERIASAAETLFKKSGMEAVTMNDIAKEAGYSKATIYVYFENKEEIIGFLVLVSMKKLHAYLTSALEENRDTRKRYDNICMALLRYYNEFPFYFKLVLNKINVDFENGNYLPEEKETYTVGEEINAKLVQFLTEGIEAGDIRKEINLLSTIFAFWGMLSGFIQLAEEKESYIGNTTKMMKKEFLNYGFDMLYRSVSL